jgi:hypothetical protein
MVGYPPYAHGYCVYNHVTRRITTSVHVIFQEDTPGFGASSATDSLITEAPYAACDLDQPIATHALVRDTPDATNGPPLLAAGHPSRLRSHPIRLGDYVAHMSEYPVSSSRRGSTLIKARPRKTLSKSPT